MFDTPKPLFPGKENENKKDEREPQDIFEKVDTGSNDSTKEKNLRVSEVSQSESLTKDSQEVFSKDDIVAGDQEFQYRAKKSFRWKRVIVIICIFSILLVGGVFGAKWYFNQKDQQSFSVPSFEEKSVGGKIEEVDSIFKNEEAEEVIEEQKTPAQASAKDSDSDGLIDEEEIELETNPRDYDSDGDKLFDFDEVRVYQTDPRNKDTDGDLYFDGEEVKNGYNPKGSGKLFEVPEP